MKNTNNHAKKIIEYAFKVAIKGEISNRELVQIIERIGVDLLNLKSIQKYADDNGISYNGAKKCRNVIELFGNKYIIDND